MQSKTTEMKIGNMTFIVTSEHSPSATETVEQKLERIISRHVSDVISDAECYQNKGGKPVDMCEKVRLYSK